VLRVSHLGRSSRSGPGAAGAPRPWSRWTTSPSSYRDRLPPLHRIGHHLVTRRQQHRHSCNC